MIGTEGEARARFSTELSAQHFADTARKRQEEEAAAGAADSTARCYQLLARDEYNTWQLLDRYLRFSQSDRAASPDAPIAWMQEVLAWLEGMVHAPSATESVRCSWDKTSQELASGRSPPDMIDAMDPDACSRQQRAVHPDDRRKEDEFLRVLWTCVRAGDVSRAQECCRKSQQWWRAASLAPAAHEQRGPARRVWKDACQDLAQDISAPSFERAVYAVLSAEPAALQAFASTGKSCIQGVLKSWYDKVYVWAKVWVDSHRHYDSAEDLQQSSPLLGEEMKQSLDSFLHMCNVPTEEDTLASTVAEINKRWLAGLPPDKVNRVNPEVASIAETWVKSAVQFYRGAQELLIFTVPSLDYQSSCSSLSRMWSDASDGVLPTSLRWPLSSNSWSATEIRDSLASDIQQLGEDLSSQLTRTALHAGILLSRSPQIPEEAFRGGAAGLITAELENLGISYIELLTGSVREDPGNGDSESLALVAEYTNWLPRHVQADTLLKVLKDLPPRAWQKVLEETVLQPEVVADVQYTVVQQFISSSAGDNDKLQTLQWACSRTDVNDGHDGLLMRIQGLRLVNSYLRMRLLEEGVEGLSGGPGCAFLDVGKNLCGAEMSDCFEAMCESFPHNLQQYNNWLQGPGAPVAYTKEMAKVSFASCQDDFREYRCWQVLLDGQHWVTQFGLAIRQGGEAGAQQQDFVYQQTTNALYPLVTCEGRWMLDINANRAHSQGQAQRAHEMEQVRKMCVPHVCFQLMHILQEFGEIHKCLHLIQIIAKEDSPLFHDFEPKMLSKLLARVPEILIRMAAQEPEALDSNTTSHALCQFLLTS